MSLYSIIRTPVNIRTMPAKSIPWQNANANRKDMPVLNSPLSSAVQWLYYAYSQGLVVNDDFVLREVSNEGYKFYDRMLDRDGHLFSTFDKLKDTAANLPYHILPASEDPVDQGIAAFIEEALAYADMEEHAKEMLRAIGIGFGVYEVTYEPFHYKGRSMLTIKDVVHVDEDYIGCTPQREFRFTPPGTGIDKALPFIPAQKHIHIRYGSGLYGDGLLKHAYPAWWFKRNSFIFCMQYVERFGNPMVIGRHKTEDEKDTVMAMLADIRSSGYASLPDGTADPSTLEPKHDPSFEWWLNFLNDEMTKIFLFGTRTMSPSNAPGAKSATETHDEQADDRILGVRKRLLRVMNKQLIPHLSRLNYGIRPRYPLAMPGSKDIDDSAEYLDKIKRAKETGLQFDTSKSDFYEKSGISKPNPEIPNDTMRINESAIVALPGSGTEVPKQTLAADTILNGVQITAIAGIIEAVASNRIPRDSGKGQIMEFLKCGPETADNMLGSAGQVIAVPAGTAIN